MSNDFIRLMQGEPPKKKTPLAGGVPDTKKRELPMEDTTKYDGYGHAAPDIDPASPEEFELLEANKADARRQVAQVIRDAHDPLVTVTRFADKKETIGKRHEVTWAKLCEVLSGPNESPDIESLPLVKFSKLPRDSRVAGTMPENMTAVVGDYDAGTVTVDEAVARLSAAGISAGIYTTRRHRTEAPRWRVVAQLASPVTPKEYAEYLDLVNGALGGILAPESWETSRSYFYGKVKGVEYRFEHVPGVPIDLKLIDGVEWEPVGKPNESARAKPSESLLTVTDDERDFERAITLNRVTDETVHDLRSALEVFTADEWDNYDFWLRACHALKSLSQAGRETEALAMYHEGSAKSPRYDHDEAQSKWDGVEPNQITYTSIFKWADAHDERHGLLKTGESWRAKAKAAWADKAVATMGSNVVPYAEFTSAMEPPSYVWHRVLQKGCLYALTAKWGHGKTAVMITVAMHVATGRELGGHQVKRQRVLYLCGENPADVQLRTTAAALKFGMDPSELAGQIFFTRRPFALDNEVELKRFVQEAGAFGPFGMAVIDTGPAHSSAEEENDNREMHKLAMAMRDLMEPLGNPATVALMHPTKEATRDNLQPRGGGAFSGSIDGELCAWQERGQVEFFHRTKFRGPGFEPMRFYLERFQLPGMEDNFGEPVVTVLAVESDNTDPAPIGRKPLTGAIGIAYRALDAALGDIKFTQTLDPATAGEASNALNCPAPDAVVHIDDWRSMAYAMGISDGDGEAKKKAFKRGREKLIADGIVKVWNDKCWLRGGA